MKLTHPAVVAFGLAMLPMLPILAGIVEPKHDILYHFDGPTYIVFFPVLISISLLWILFTAILMLARKLGKARFILWSALMFMLPWVLLKTFAILLDLGTPNHLSLLVFLAGIAATATFVACWRPSFQRGFDRAQEFTATLLAFSAFSAPLIIGHLCWSAWQSRSANPAIPMHRYAVARSTPHPRIIWVILDELSYRQVYEHRYPSLALPAFDRLAAQSTVFTQVAPAGIMTEYAIPSLMSGIRADDMRASPDGRQLYLHDPSHNHWQNFDPHRTVFQDALDRGYSTAVAGWYNPYCRLLAPVLDHCFWTNRTPTPSGTSRDQTLLSNVLAPFRYYFETFEKFLDWRKLPISPDQTGAYGHVHDYADLLAASDALLNDSSANLLYLHLPIPHPLGIYNRQTRQLTTGPSTYIDNLALADVYLGHLRTQLEQRGEWDSSAILIMGDHSWRTQRWFPTWYPEEWKASDGAKFDSRPAYILKLPNQQQPAHIDTPYPAFRTRALIDALMDQRIQSPQDLEDWVAVPPAEPPANSLAQ
jgi:hypothetical protein